MRCANHVQSKETTRKGIVCLTVAKFATTAVDGKTYQVEHYSLEVFRVHEIELCRNPATESEGVIHGRQQGRKILLCRISARGWGKARAGKILGGRKSFLPASPFPIPRYPLPQNLGTDHTIVPFGKFPLWPHSNDRKISPSVNLPLKAEAKLW